MLLYSFALLGVCSMVNWMVLLETAINGDLL